MTHDELREAVARKIAYAAHMDVEPSMAEYEIYAHVDERWKDWLPEADAALSTIRAVFANPTPEMVRASVQGWLDSGLMSGAIREAAREALGDADTR